MSAGGVFKILTNDGKADQLLMATQLLKDRICNIMDAREAAGMDDTLPTLKDLEKTHILHFQSKFKPFVALGYEYQKVNSSSGSASFGNTVTYSIPQFGDFLSDMVLNIVFTEAKCAAAALQTLSSVYKSVNADLSSSSTAVSNTVITLPDPDGSHLNSLESVVVDGVKRQIVRILKFVDYVDEDGAPVPSDALRADRVFYCDYPGERVMSEVSFEVNGNPLDNYDVNSYAFYRKYRVTADRKVAYDRNMGQEIAADAYTLPTSLGERRMAKVCSGPQTPLDVQPALSMWVKLLFWFNTDQSQALVSAAIPYGQRFINVKTAAVSDIIFRAPACWARAILTTSMYKDGDITVSGSNWDLSVIAGSSPSKTPISSHKQILHYPVYTNGTMSYPSIKTMDLYVNNIFTIPEVHDIYIDRIGFSLIRVHRIHTASINVASSETLLSNFKYPVEFFYCGLRPLENKTGAYRYRDWHRMTYVQRSLALGSSVKAVDAEDRIVATSDTLIREDEVSAISSAAVSAHGVQLYAEFSSAFYNQYLPEVYGGPLLVSPSDPGVLFVNFCLYPNSMQPSGHVNTSRAREFFLNLKSDYVGSAVKTADLLSEASALNFLLVSDGTAVLRYTT